MLKSCQLQVLAKSPSKFPMSPTLFLYSLRLFSLYMSVALCYIYRSSFLASNRIISCLSFILSVTTFLVTVLLFSSSIIINSLFFVLCVFWCVSGYCMGVVLVNQSCVFILSQRVHYAVLFIFVMIYFLFYVSFSINRVHHGRTEDFLSMNDLMYVKFFLCVWLMFAKLIWHWVDGDVDEIHAYVLLCLSSMALTSKQCIIAINILVRNS